MPFALLDAKTHRPKGICPETTNQSGNTNSSFPHGPSPLPSAEPGEKKIYKSPVRQLSTAEIQVNSYQHK